MRKITPEEELEMALMIPCTVCRVGAASYCESYFGKTEFIHPQRIINAWRLCSYGIERRRHVYEEG